MPLAVTVNLKEFTPTEEAAASVSVVLAALPLTGTELGLHEAVTPVGNPLTAMETGPAKEPRVVIWKLLETLAPGATDMLLWAAEIDSEGPDACTEEAHEISKVQNTKVILSATEMRDKNDINIS